MYSSDTVTGQAIEAQYRDDTLPGEVNVAMQSSDTVTGQAIEAQYRDDTILG